MTIWTLLMKQVSIFTESLLELLDIRFERAKNHADRKIQYKANAYVRSSVRDGVHHFSKSIASRAGFAHCWLALLVCMWVLSLSAVVCYEGTQTRLSSVLNVSKSYLSGQYEASSAFFQALCKALVGQVAQWQAGGPAYKALTRLAKPSLTFD